MSRGIWKPKRKTKVPKLTLKNEWLLTNRQQMLVDEMKREYLRKGKAELRDKLLYKYYSSYVGQKTVIKRLKFLEYIKLEWGRSTFNPKSIIEQG